MMAMTALLCGIGASALRAADDDGLNWHSDYRKALNEARQTNRPLLVEFRCEA